GLPQLAVGVYHRAVACNHNSPSKSFYPGINQLTQLSDAKGFYSNRIRQSRRVDFFYHRSLPAPHPQDRANLRGAVLPGVRLNGHEKLACALLRRLATRALRPHRPSGSLLDQAVPIAPARPALPV